jgi:DNA-binding winged helix-turn-helix (wHTH) protein
VVSSSNPNVLVRFGPFELDVRTGELRRDGTSLKLQPQPAKVLQLLVARAGEIVTRQDLAQQVWSSDTFVDFDQGLNYAIRQIRTALDDDAERPRYLETLPKRGYRFISQIEDVKPKTSVDPPPGSNEILPSANTPDGQSRTWVKWAAASVGALLLAIAAWIYIAGDGSSVPWIGPSHSIGRSLATGKSFGRYEPGLFRGWPYR